MLLLTSKACDPTIRCHRPASNTAPPPQVGVSTDASPYATGDAAPRSSSPHSSPFRPGSQIQRPPVTPGGSHLPAMAMVKKVVRWEATACTGQVCVYVGRWARSWAMREVGWGGTI